jgi:CheY-like chemotaxis protein
MMTRPNFVFSRFTVALKCAYNVCSLSPTERVSPARHISSLSPAREFLGKEVFMSEPIKARHQPTVLLVEDDEATRDLMTKILVAEGYLTLTAESSHDALSILHAPLEPIDVVILDVHLPDVSGIDLCARIKELRPNLPIVVCTGEAEIEEAARLLEMGVHRYFRKPIAVEELLATVEAACRRE